MYYLIFFYNFYFKLTINTPLHHTNSEINYCKLEP